MARSTARLDRPVALERACSWARTTIMEVTATGSPIDWRALIAATRTVSSASIIDLMSGSTPSCGADPAQGVDRGPAGVLVRIGQQPLVDGLRRGAASFGIAIVEGDDERLDDAYAAPSGQGPDGGATDVGVVVGQQPHQGIDRHWILERREGVGGRGSDCGVLEGESLDQALDVPLRRHLLDVGRAKEGHRGDLHPSNSDRAVAATAGDLLTCRAEASTDRSVRRESRNAATAA